MDIEKFHIKHDARREDRNISDLAMEIKVQTLLQPIVVMECEGGYEVCDGRRRFKAMKEFLGYTELEENVHYIVREGLDALAVQFSANSCREDFTPIEIAELIKEIHEKGIKERGAAITGVAGSGWRMSDTAKLVNRDKGYVSKMLQIADNKKIFHECTTITECFNALSKEKSKKMLNRVKKVKIEKAISAEDVEDIFKTVHIAPAEKFILDVKDESIDFIHVDPPFAINYGDLLETEQYDVEYKDNPEQIKMVLNEVIDNFYRILKPNRYGVIWCGYFQSFEVVKRLLASGLKVHSVPIVWTKLSTGGRTMQPNVRIGSAAQFAVNFWKGEPELSIKGRHNYFPYNVVKNNRIHQAQMPEELIIDIIKIFSNQNDVVFDCFAGSLSTLRACYATKRHFIGCELQAGNVENGKSITIDWINNLNKKLRWGS